VGGDVAGACILLLPCVHHEEQNAYSHAMVDGDKKYF
jgi:hypothetical protein